MRDLLSKVRSSFTGLDSDGDSAVHARNGQYTGRIGFEGLMQHTRSCTASNRYARGSEERGLVMLCSAPPQAPASPMPSLNVTSLPEVHFTFLRVPWLESLHHRLNGKSLTMYRGNFRSSVFLLLILLHSQTYHRRLGASGLTDALSGLLSSIRRRQP